MTSIEAQQIARRLFEELRQREFALGVRELLDVLALIEGGWAYDSPERLETDLRMLWGHLPGRPGSEAEFENAWQCAIEQGAEAEPGEPPPPPIERPDPGPAHEPESFADPAPAPPAPAREAEPSILPVQPAELPREGASGRVAGYGPLSRESMAHGWRSLRRPRRDGPFDVLDVSATVEQAAQQGFFLTPVYRRREINHARLVLLLDQGGSMVPFHRFGRDLVETALQEQERHLQRVEVFYFHNHFAGTLYRDPFMTEAVGREEVLGEIDAETSVLIVSDAGAARGGRRRERIRATAAMAHELRSRTNWVAWLNPMPRARWEASSAEVIAHLAPQWMFPLDEQGFSSAVDLARGLLAIGEANAQG